MYSPKKIVQIIKSITAREAFKKIPKLKKEQLWGGQLWTDGYFVSTVGKHGNEGMISNYVKKQGQSDKEYKRLYEQKHGDHDCVKHFTSNCCLNISLRYANEGGISDLLPQGILYPSRVELTWQSLIVSVNPQVKKKATHVVSIDSIVIPMEHQLLSLLPKPSQQIPWPLSIQAKNVDTNETTINAIRVPR